MGTSKRPDDDQHPKDYGEARRVRPGGRRESRERDHRAADRTTDHCHQLATALAYGNRARELLVGDEATRHGPQRGQVEGIDDPDDQAGHRQHG